MIWATEIPASRSSRCWYCWYSRGFAGLVHRRQDLDQILPQQPFGGAVLAAVAVLAERARHPGVE